MTEYFLEKAKKSKNKMEISMLECFDRRRLRDLSDKELLDELKRRKSE